MLPQDRIDEAERRLGFSFKDKDLLKRALTHRSFAFEAKAVVETNEKLEFLGDSVLNFVITDFIFRRFPKFDEGRLAELRANLVNMDTLANLARRMDLGRCIFMGRGAELTGGREKASILADCFEAVLGAIYLDLGIEEARGFILREFRDVIFQQVTRRELADFKTILQEYAMDKIGVMPIYEIVQEEGPVHERTFYAQVSIGGEILGQGMGRSKKKAERAAAKEALEALRQKFS